jgi:thiamine-phosphate pyrophosphorylase
MQIVVISPESSDPREVSAMKGFFAAGLRRYHVRKPTWSARRLETWLRRLRAEWRPRLVLHQHHSLVEKLGLGGRHYPDDPSRQAGASCSCHDLRELRRRVTTCDQILFGPIFPSLSKPGYGPAADFPWGKLTALLRGRRAMGSGNGSRVLAIGGVTADRLARCDELGLDGAAVLGAVWNGPDPVRALREILDTATRLEVAHRAA